MFTQIINFLRPFEPGPTFSLVCFLVVIFFAESDLFPAMFRCSENLLCNFEVGGDVFVALAGCVFFRS